jgi:hypothetical protein
MTQCLGWLKDGSRQCKKIGIREKKYLYCQYHNPTNADAESEESGCSADHHTHIETMPHQCSAWLVDGSRRCHNTGIADKDYLYCRFHSPPPEIEYPICQGLKRNGSPCRAQVRHPRCGKYCRDDHDPTLERSTDTADFRIDGLRGERETAVLEFRDSMDIYTGMKVVDTVQAELDHSLELQCGRDCYDRVEGRTACLKNKIKVGMNENVNLNFTSKEINYLKFRGVNSFCNDYKCGTVSDEGLMFYLQNAHKDDNKLSRRVTGAIAKEMVLSYDGVVAGFEQENWDQSLFCDHFHDMVIVSMRLK